MTGETFIASLGLIAVAILVAFIVIGTPILIYDQVKYRKKLKQQSDTSTSWVSGTGTPSYGSQSTGWYLNSKGQLTSQKYVGTGKTIPSGTIATGTIAAKPPKFANSFLFSTGSQSAGFLDSRDLTGLEEHWTNEPIEAWKVIPARFVKYDGMFLGFPHPDGPSLEVTLVDHSWGKAEAKCDAWDVDGVCESSPGLFCKSVYGRGCGWYAYKSWHAAFRHLENAKSHSLGEFAIAKVVLTGRVVEYELGYRAQFMEVDYVEYADSFSELYGKNSSYVQVREPADIQAKKDFYFLDPQDGKPDMLTDIVKYWKTYGKLPPNLPPITDA